MKFTTALTASAFFASAFAAEIESQEDFFDKFRFQKANND